jgi:hypothetical protein
MEQQSDTDDRSLLVKLDEQDAILTPRLTEALLGGPVGTEDVREDEEEDFDVVQHLSFLFGFSIFLPDILELSRSISCTALSRTPWICLIVTFCIPNPALDRFCRKLNSSANDSRLLRVMW